MDVTTGVVGVIFVTAGFLFLGAAFSWMSFMRGLDPEATPADITVMSGFVVILAAILYWSGSRLFIRPAIQARLSQNLADLYVGPWIPNAPPDIVRALALHRVRGCDEVHYKPSRRSGSDYLVYCTADGEHWVAYLVSLNLDRIEGPAHPDPAIEPPR